jgi:hypothetical protein
MQPIGYHPKEDLADIPIIPIPKEALVESGYKIDT